jgi:hypothetical protein
VELISCLPKVLKACKKKKFFLNSHFRDKIYSKYGPLSFSLSGITSVELCNPAISGTSFENCKAQCPFSYTVAL